MNKTKISRPTVSQIKKSLIKENFLKIINIPNIKKLNCDLLVYLNTKKSLGKIKQDQEISSLIFTDYDEYKKLHDKLISSLEKEEEPEKYLFPISQIVSEKIDFAPLVKKIFGLKADY